MKIRTFACIAALFFSSTLSAAPAAWYQWRSKVTSDEICAQTTPGEGWEKWRGPFKDARCSKRGTPRGHQQPWRAVSS